MLSPDVEDGGVAWRSNDEVAPAPERFIPPESPPEDVYSRPGRPAFVSSASISMTIFFDFYYIKNEDEHWITITTTMTMTIMVTMRKK
jgi:hypothetical protein